MSLLGPIQVIPHLLGRGLLDPADVVDGSVKVVDGSRRNRNLKVTSERGPGFLLKQGVDAGGRKTVAHEADIYRLMDSLPSRDRLARYLPRFHSYDPEHHILVMELVPDAENLRDYDSRRRACPPGVAAGTGRALAALHDLARTPGDAAALGQLRGRLPWALAMNRPGLAAYRESSNANFQLIRIIQNQAGFSELLDGVRESWRFDAFIHHDFKWENCLVHPEEGGARKSAIKLVDWEFADLGDACWDVGSAFAAYLGCWLFSIPLTGADPPERFLDFASRPLDRMQPAMRAFWQAYARGMDLDSTSASERLLRSARYSAVRLLQTGYEHLQKSAEMTGNVVCMLQLSFNILQRPREAIAHLLGIPLPHESAAAT